MIPEIQHRDIFLSGPGQPGRSGRRHFLFMAGGAVGLVALRLAPAPLAWAATNVAPGSVKLIEFGANGRKTGEVVVSRVVKTEEEWKSKLSPISYEVTRHAATERPYSGDTWDLHEAGVFRCVCCDTAVFSSETKFDSGTGWPSFWQPIARQNVVEVSDRSLGTERTAVSCRLCDAHLGHVFNDGPRPTGQRYCMNSAAMHFARRA